MDIAKTINYCLGFAQIKNKITFEDIKKNINRILAKNLLPLPTTPEDIPEEILELLPFSLPIKN